MFITEDISLEQYKKAYQEERKKSELEGFLIHLAAFVFVNILLTITNLLYVPEVIWFFFPLVGWGIGIIIHYLMSVRWVDRALEVEEMEAEKKAKRKGN